MKWPHTTTEFSDWMKEKHAELWKQVQKCHLEWNEEKHKQKWRVITLILLLLGFALGLFWHNFEGGLIAGAMLAFITLVYLSFAHIEWLKREMGETK